MGYKELDVWNVAMELALMVYEATRGFPKEEQFGLTTQMRRAAVSIAANIAEGYGRRSPADYARFLRIAKGSTNELETLTILSQRLQYLKDPESLLAVASRVGAMLTGLVKSVEGNVVREIAAMYSDEELPHDDEPLSSTDLPNDRPSEPS